MLVREVRRGDVVQIGPDVHVALVAVHGLDAALEALRMIANPATDTHAHQAIAEHALRRLDTDAKVELGFDAPRSLTITRV